MIEFLETTDRIPPRKGPKPRGNVRILPTTHRMPRKNDQKRKETHRIPPRQHPPQTWTKTQRSRGWTRIFAIGKLSHALDPRFIRVHPRLKFNSLGDFRSIPIAFPPLLRRLLPPALRRPDQFRERKVKTHDDPRQRLNQRSVFTHPTLDVPDRRIAHPAGLGQRKSVRPPRLAPHPHLHADPVIDPVCVFMRGITIWDRHTNARCKTAALKIPAKKMRPARHCRPCPLHETALRAASAIRICRGRAITPRSPT